MSDFRKLKNLVRKLFHNRKEKQPNPMRIESDIEQFGIDCFKKKRKELKETRKLDSCFVCQCEI